MILQRPRVLCRFLEHRWRKKKSSNYLTRGQERSCEASYSWAGRGGHGYATAFLTTATLALGTTWHDWGLQTSIGTCDLSGWHWAATCLALGTGTFGSCHHYGLSIMGNGCKKYLSSLFFTKPTFDSIINFCFFDLTVDDFKLIAELWVGRPADAENWEQVHSITRYPELHKPAVPLWRHGLLDIRLLVNLALSQQLGAGFAIFSMHTVSF